MGTKTLTINNPNGEAFTSVISGVGGGKIVKNGSGKLILSASTGSYDGGLTLNGGSVGIGANPGFGAGPLTINSSITIGNTSSGGRAPNSTAVILNGDLTFDDSFTTGTLGTITWGSGTLWTIKGANRTISVNAPAVNYTVTINGVIGQDVPGRGLTKIGNGILALGALNAYTGDTTVNAGLLQVNGTSTI